MKKFMAGAAATDITPHEPHFLHGYPFVERMSTGTHDSLLASALYLSDGVSQALFISCDVIYLHRESVARIRTGICRAAGIPERSIIVAATHTHSGPVTVDCAVSAADSVVPPADPEYLRYMEERAVGAALRAVGNAVPAEAAFVCADASGTGGNRHDPAGAGNREVPVMAVRNDAGRYIACLLVCGMHPTVLHEDSTLYSADFPHYVRDTLRRELPGGECTVVYFTGAAGDQSPRHVTRENTFAEAERIGRIVADSVLAQLAAGAEYSADIPIEAGQAFSELPRRDFPDPRLAEQNRDERKHRLETLRKSSADLRAIRTAEVDWFGSEELLTLSRLAASGALERFYEGCLPAEIQVIGVGGRHFVAWPGEIFAHYGLELKKHCSEAVLISCANGELQGYIATREAHEKGYYEAGNSFFTPEAGDMLVDKTIGLISKPDTE